MRMLKMTACLLLSATALFPVHAMAQTAPASAPDTGAPSPAPSAGIGDIVVTAQRREERLQNVPVSITAFNQDALTKTDTRDLTRLEQFTPGLTFGQSGFDFKPAIRGAATLDVDTNSATPIGFYVDDIYQTLAVEASQPFVDVSSVEVDRGPQGTLFGRNTSGGAIAVRNNLPGKIFDAGLNLTYGNYDRKQVNGFVSVPITDRLGVRIAGQYENRDGYIKNVVDPGNDLYNRRSRYLRGTVRWTPTDRLEVTLRGTIWHEGGTGAIAYGYQNGGLLVDPATGVGDLNGTPLYFYTHEVLDGVPDIPGSAACTGSCRDVGVRTPAGPFEWAGQYKPSGRIQLYSTSGQLRWANDDIFLRSITSYEHFEYSSNSGATIGPSVTTYDQQRNTNTITQEFQIGGVSTKPIQWIAGLYYYRDRDYENFIIYDPTYYCCGPTRNPTNSYAAYGQVSYDITSKLRLTAGARYTIDKRRQNAESVFYTLPVTDPSTTLPTSAGVQHKDFKRLTWRAGADYSITSANMLYASVSTGFRAGGFNSASLQNPSVPATFGPERVIAYEIGSKNRFWDNRIQLNIAAYYNKFRNLQVPTTFPLPPPSISVVSASLNAGAARAYGVEIEGIFKPTRDFTINATANFVNAKYTDYRYLGAPSRFYPTEEQDLSGNEIPDTPRQKFTVGAQYDIRIDGFGTITPQANALISSHFYNTSYNSVLDIQHHYTTLDASLGWTSEDGRIGVQAFGTNLTNKAVLNSAEFGSQTLITSYNQPRFYGVRLSLKMR
ncbi:hypothetical protein DMC47_34465 [Nostoc sp. 3335mG]|nr:hypothetical protein DMC47_34465 [Nostoc sp. 3335mG]